VANERFDTMNVHELVRLKRLNRSNAEIARLMDCTRPTVIKYVDWAGREGFLDGELPDAATIQARLEATLPQRRPPQQASSIAKYTERVRELRALKMEIAAIRARLKEETGQTLSYEALRRLVHQLEPREPEAYVRVETLPGQEAQVDFGYAGLTRDPATGRLRKTWLFVMLLSFSRHLYAELVYDQSVATWLACHIRAFAAFGGVPQRIVLDNLKAAIIKACRQEPAVQRSYRELANHYGFLIDPNPPAMPHLKGKVEQGGVHYVKRNFLAGREAEPTDQLQAKLDDWVQHEAGTRRHGTTQARPLERFALEQPALLALPRSVYDLADWRQPQVERDCYVAIDGAFYSAPQRLVGSRLWARVGLRTVTLYGEDHVAIFTHQKAEPGGRQTCLDHLPAGKVAGLTLTREGCREQARRIGPATLQLVEQLLAERPVDKLRTAGRLLALSRRYDAARLEAACAEALACGQADYLLVKTILRGTAPAAPQPEAIPAEPRSGYAFARAASDYLLRALWAVGGAA
jgi:transposase